jgi:hypothetical protein
MREYDTTLKSLLTRLAGPVLAGIAGLAVERRHNVELPAVRHRRADLLGEASDGRLLHIELQSTNQSHMARRMPEYATSNAGDRGAALEEFAVLAESGSVRFPNGQRNGSIASRRAISTVFRSVCSMRRRSKTFSPDNPGWLYSCVSAHGKPVGTVPLTVKSPAPIPYNSG